MGSSETSAPVTTLFAPTLQEGDETVLATCCSGVNDDRKNDQWLTTVDTEGDLLYWHEQLSGNDFESLKLTLLPFNNAETDLSVSLTCRDSTEETKTSCGTATLTSLSDSVALWDQWRFEHDIIATWEGAPNGLSRRAVSFDIDQNSFTPQYGLFPLDTWPDRRSR